MSPDLGKSRLHPGYRRTSLAVNAAFNFTLATFLLSVSAPLFALIAFLNLILNGRPIFYCGTRMGIRKSLFKMYKFRTLVRDADKIVGSELLSKHHKVVTPLGQILRDTRLDELPQLFNILRGDMDFVGPRPVRPEVYEKFCRHIGNYDLRFEVKPGLLGFSQIFTPHSAPKRVRSLIDNRFIRIKQVLAFDAALVLFTGGLVLQQVVIRLGRHALRLLRRLVHARDWQEKREEERVRPEAVVVVPLNDDDTRMGDLSCPLVDINEDAFLIRCTEKIADPFPARFLLQVRFVCVRGHKQKTAKCSGELFRHSERQDGTHDYVVRYKPLSTLHAYMIQQYFLRRSMA